MTTCPLPLDWLDLLERRPSAADRAHLAGCDSCRAVVAALDATNAPGPALPGDHDAPHLRLNDVMTPIREGQIRWLAARDGDVRIPVIVLYLDDDGTDIEAAVDPADTTGPRAEPTYAQVVPVWTDRENATSADLLLAPQDTTVGLAWRVALRRQATVPADALGSQVGVLTGAGREKVSSALDGVLPLEATGAELESEFDPRLTADAWIGDILEQAWPTTGSPSALEDPADLVAADAGKTYLFELKRVSQQPSRRFALAAASARPGTEAVHASLRTATGVAVDGVFRWLLPIDGTDRLVLHADAVTGVEGWVVLILYTHGKGRFEKRARLSPGTDIILAEDVAVSDRDVERLEMQLA